VGGGEPSAARLADTSAGSQLHADPLVTSHEDLLHERIKGARERNMKKHKAQLPLASCLYLILLASGLAYAQITPASDAYINTADSTTNYGAKTLLDVDGAT